MSAINIVICLFLIALLPIAAHMIIQDLRICLVSDLMRLSSFRGGKESLSAASDFFKFVAKAKGMRFYGISYAELGLTDLESLHRDAMHSLRLARLRLSMQCEGLKKDDKTEEETRLLCKAELDLESSWHELDCLMNFWLMNDDLSVYRGRADLHSQ